MAAPKVKEQYKLIKLTSIHIEEQVRTIFEQSSIAELADNIRQVGKIIQPITVRPRPGIAEGQKGEYELVAGERRVRAATMAGLTKVPAMIFELTDEQALDFQLSENLQRKNLTPMEEAVSFKKSMEKLHIPPVELAAKIGKTLDYVQRRVRLNNLVDLGQQYVHQHVIPLHIADLIAPLQPVDQEKLIKNVVVHKLGPGDADNNRPGSLHCKSLADVRWYLQQYVLNVLETAPFSKTTKIPGVDMPACTQCPQRTGYTASLFHDIVDNDRCLNPKCFSAKTEAHFEAIADRLEQLEGKRLPFLRLGDAPAPKKQKLLEQYTVRLLPATGDDPCRNAEPVCVLEKGKEPRVERACLSMRCACRKTVKASVPAHTLNAYTPEQVTAARHNLTQRVKEETYQQLLTEAVVETEPFGTHAAMMVLVFTMARNVNDQTVLDLFQEFDVPLLDDDGQPYQLPTNLNASRVRELMLKTLQPLQDNYFISRLAWALFVRSPVVQDKRGGYLNMLAEEQLSDEFLVKEKLLVQASKQADASVADLFATADFQPDENGVVHLPQSIAFHHRLDTRVSDSDDVG